MSRLLLALLSLSAGVGAFVVAHPLTRQLKSEASAAAAAWVAETQLVARAQTDQAALTAQAGQLERDLAQASAVVENPLWTAVETNLSGRLPVEVRRGLLAELGFDWRTSGQFVVISKDALRELGMRTINKGKLTEEGVAVFAMTPEERGQVEDAVEQVSVEFKDWALAHTERIEPKDDEVAHYTLQNDPQMTISNNFVNRLTSAVGKQRAGFMLTDVRNLLNFTGFYGEPFSLVVRRKQSGNETRLEVDVWGGRRGSHSWRELSVKTFLEEFRPVFPNGWVDVAKQEGFELPEEARQE